MSERFEDLMNERIADLQTKIHMLEHELLVEREATLYVRIELQNATRNLTSVQARCTELREENLKLKERDYCDPGTLGAAN